MNANKTAFLTELAQVQHGTIARPNPIAAIVQQSWQRLKTAAALVLPSAYDDQVGGYVHDTATSFFIPPAMCMLTVGAWVDTVSPTTALVYMKKRTAAAATNQCIIPIRAPQNSVASKGSYLKSIDIWWETTVAAHTTLTALISKIVLPADTVAIGAPTAPAFTYDSLNLTNATRVAIEQRKMTLTITTPIWLDDDDHVYVDLTLVEATTTQFDFYGARANVTLRI